MTVTVSQARPRLSELIRRAEQGEDIRIARYRGPSAVRLVAENPPANPKRRVDWKRKLAEMPRPSFNLDEAFAMIAEERRRR